VCTNAAAGSSGHPARRLLPVLQRGDPPLLPAAAAVSGRDIATVRQWVNRAESHDAIRCLRDSPAAPEWADDLEAITGMHDQAVSNVFSGARRAYDCLADPRVLRACHPGVAAGFNAGRIITERAALFIIGTSGAQGAWRRSSLRSSRRL
jgi:hypothetical protein